VKRNLKRKMLRVIAPRAVVQRWRRPDRILCRQDGGDDEGLLRVFREQRIDEAMTRAGERWNRVTAVLEAKEAGYDALGLLTHRLQPQRPPTRSGGAFGLPLP